MNKKMNDEQIRSQESEIRNQRPGVGIQKSVVRSQR